MFVFTYIYIYNINIIYIINIIMVWTRIPPGPPQITNANFVGKVFYILYFPAAACVSERRRDSGGVRTPFVVIRLL